MPEGDTLWRTAARLQPALAGRVVTAFRAHSPTLAAAGRRHRVEGSTVTGVEARGKHLLVRFSTGVALHTHMGMTGSWHLYRPGSRWRQPEHLARIVIETAEVLAVCFVPRVAELLPERDEAAHEVLTALGPDVVEAGFDVEAALQRVRARPDGEIGAVLLDQRAISGIGNMHKSEALFACGLDPSAHVEEIDDGALRRLLRTSHERMRRSALVGSPSAMGAPRDRHWVYGRYGLPCRRCATRIERRRQGSPSRTTYWCPTCQRSRGERS